ncbi:Protein RecA, partial [Clarias magur]
MDREPHATEHATACHFGVVEKDEAIHTEAVAGKRTPQHKQVYKHNHELFSS